MRQVFWHRIILIWNVWAVCLIVLCSGLETRAADAAVRVPVLWPGESKNTTVRFIRLQYDGAGWDDGMDARSRADMNFLETFRELSGGQKIGSKSESHPIATLKRYPKGQAPPMVYMTGTDKIGGITKADMAILREYLMKGGGMLLADCGSPEWHKSFAAFANGLLPGMAMQKIADDDPIFQVPFTFRNGAPALWHHGGYDAMGIRYKGRLVVFYHPGDLNDAWKTGHSGMSRDQAQGAFQMGVNILYYSSTRYAAFNRRNRFAPAYRTIRSTPAPKIIETDYSFGKGVLTVRRPGRAPDELRGCAPWAFSDLTSVKVFASAPVQDKRIGLLRDQVYHMQDILDVVDKLDDAAIEAHDVSLPGIRTLYSGRGIRTNLALLLDMGAGRYVALFFASNSDLTWPLKDSLLVTVREGRTEILADVIPKLLGPSPADLRRLLSWYESRFDFIPTGALADRLMKRKKAALAAAAKAQATMDAARPSGMPALEGDMDSLSRDLDEEN